MNSRLIRRTRIATATLVLALVVAACGDEDTTNAATSVKVAYYPGALVSLPALVAHEKGFYADNGLDVSLVQVPNGPAMTSGLASGSLDFVNNSYDNLA
ncbi:MAG TPA: ABC transporter substrate-binding protein, partial [Jiangellaceae bacterium]